jgi:hypothetical protein
MFAKPPPTAVTVRLAGPETGIRKLDPLRLAVRLELANAPPGERDVQLSEAHLTGVPAGFVVRLFSPDRLSLTLDRRMRRELAIAPDLVGALPEGSFVYHVQARPEALLVEGPEAQVSAMTSLRTDPIQLGGRTRGFVETVAAISDHALVRVVGPRSVEVRVVVDAAPVSLTLGGVPVLLSGQRSGEAAVPAVLRVTVAGPPALLESLTSQQIRAVADAGAADPASASRRVPVQASVVDLPLEQLWRVRVKSIDPPEVSIRSGGGRS